MGKVTIDGIEVEVQDGINIIEAAKVADVHVPHFCYHPSLTVVGQCRMCLVEVEGMPKLQAGCSTTVKDGMKIHVWNEKVEKARRGQMEFLLINHPLDCPICDKAGECPLQDYSFNYGSVESRYGEFKRTYPGMDRTAIGPHVVQNMNRCIHCTRCIRFCQEITQTNELAFFKRGAATEVGVFPGTPIDNWMSACVTDLCPTGALTTREFRFESRVWNLESVDSVCNGCDVGCNIFIGHRNGQIFRYRPRVNPDVNDHWLCDYGRFSYERYDTDRVVVPKVRNADDYFGISTWGEALDAIEKAIRSAGRIAAIASANAASAGIGAQQGQLETAQGRLSESDNPYRVSATQAQADAAFAQAGSLQAQVKTAQDRLGYTEIRSDIDGIVGAKNIAVGATVAPGQSLMTIVPDHGLYITSNYKETQLGNVKVGQPVDVKVDAYKGVAFQGHVCAIAPASQNTFSLVPAQNATGNFVKVTQRIPVRVCVDNPPADTPLRVGMSVVTSIKVK